MTAPTLRVLGVCTVCQAPVKDREPHYVEIRGWRKHTHSGYKSPTELETTGRVRCASCAGMTQLELEFD